MSFVQREIDKLELELLKAPMDGALYAQIYAAKQALHWATDPNTAASPYAMITETRGDNSVNVEIVELPAA